MTEPAPDAPATDTTDTQPQQPKPTETVDFWKQKAREQEKRAKDNADAARRLAEIEEAQKTAEQKQAERLAQLEQEASAARAEALRLRIAARFGIADEDADLFLTGTDEDTLTRQAKRLADRDTERKKNGNHVPREGGSPRPAPADDRRAFADFLTGRGNT